MSRDPLTLALIGLVLALQIVREVLNAASKKKNGHITEDKMRLIVSEEGQKTRHGLRNDMQVMYAAFREDLRDKFR